MVTVTRGPWNVGSISGAGINGVRFEPFRVITAGSKRKYMYPSCYGTLFPDQEAATAYAVERGFSQIWYPRPNGFINLRLSPRTRKYLKSLKGDERWDTLERILLAKDSSPVTLKAYLQAIRKGAKIKGGIHDRWNAYMDGKHSKEERYF